MIGTETQRIMAKFKKMGFLNRGDVIILLIQN